MVCYDIAMLKLFRTGNKLKNKINWLKEDEGRQTNRQIIFQSKAKKRKRINFRKRFFVLNFLIFILSPGNFFTLPNARRIGLEILKLPLKILEE